MCNEIPLGVITMKKAFANLKSNMKFKLITEHSKYSNQFLSFVK